MDSILNSRLNQRHLLGAPRSAAALQLAGKAPERRFQRASPAAGFC